MYKEVYGWAINRLGFKRDWGIRRSSSQVEEQADSKRRRNRHGKVGTSETGIGA